MKISRLSFSSELYFNCLFALLTVAATTVPLALIGRDTLGEAVIALLYLLPVGWSAARWGQVPGFCAAVAAALAFDFFFIPPFHTFTVGNLEGWLVLIIFLVVAIIVIGRIQSGLTKAQASEREAVFMYELSLALSGLRTQEAVMHTMVRHLQQMLQAELVQIFIRPENGSLPMIAEAPTGGVVDGKPDCILPILASPGLIGEIRIWRGSGWLPPEDSRLSKNIVMQAEVALERARAYEVDIRMSEVYSTSR